MATKKQKRERGIARREAFEAEERERGQHFLKLSQEEHRANREKTEQQRLDKAKAKSKKLAADHKKEQQREKDGIKTHHPMPKGRSILAKIANKSNDANPANQKELAT